MASPASRTTGFFAILGVHALLLFGLANTLQLHLLEPAAPVLTAFGIIEPKPPIDPPAPVVIDTALPLPVSWASTVPEISIPAAIESPIRLPAPAPLAPAAAPARVPAPTPLVAQAIRSPDEYYPSLSVRQGEQGTTVVLACVDSGGRLQREPSIESSSGSALLDAAAIKWASEALRFTPATRDGRAVAACKGFRVLFRLTGRQ